MQPRLDTAAVSPAAVDVHCQRTAAVAKLIAHHLFLPSEEKDLLCAACLLHHRSIALIAPKGMERLLADIFGEDAPALVVDDPVPVIVRGFLKPTLFLAGERHSNRGWLASCGWPMHSIRTWRRSRSTAKRLAKFSSDCEAVWRPVSGWKNRSMRWCSRRVLSR